MDVLFAASEVAPLSKTGGLADVADALPRALAARGHAIAVVTPRYGSIRPEEEGFEPVPEPLQVRGEAVSAWARRAPGRPTVYLVEHERYFGSRGGLYGEGGHDYGDNAERFAWFTRAALALPGAVRLRPSILHLNDWQTGLAPWLLRHGHGDDPALAGARTVFTIHNLAYQGLFPKSMVPALGIPWDVFHYEGMEFHDQLNFMKAGIAYADAITTVSPTYAREILTFEDGAGLDAVLRHRARDLHGILNGIDVETWDPARDPNLPARYSAAALDGKAASKAALQRELGLPARPDVPLVSMVGRLVEQKGIDLVLAALPEILTRETQLAVLGSGRREYEDALARAARERPDRLAVRIGFDDALAHRMEAGGDAFLMPSRFEPCGLNPMTALRYGTVPIVRAVGGLQDTVEDYDGWRSGTGFKFREYTPQALLVALRRALDVYRDRRAWRGLVERGMAQDNSWALSAAAYEALYRSLAPEAPLGSASRRA